MEGGGAVVKLSPPPGKTTFKKPSLIRVNDFISNDVKTDLFTHGL